MLSFKSVISLLAICLLSNSISAQLSSNFTASVTSGCSPLSVSFANNSTGTSNAAIFQWDFGNKNKVTTTKKDSAVGAIYSIDSNYTVTLTITDGSNVSTSSVAINVFKKPIASFIIDKYGGCSPLSVSFTSTSKAGSGNINYYLWDFGNGNVLQGDSLSSVTNNFLYGGNFPVKLLVRNTNNCSSVQVINDSLVKVLQSPVANYVKDINILCAVGDTVHFKNKTTYTIGTTYLWNFGDGTTSTQSAPFNKYLVKGVFQDTMIATNSNGCTDTSISKSQVNVANFNTNFSLQDSVCANSNVTFTNVSTPSPNSSVWKSSDTAIIFGGRNYKHIFTKVGLFQVTLINKFGACVDSVVKSLKVVTSGALSKFVVNNVPLCNGKISIILSDTVTGDKNWEWQLGNSGNIQKSQTANYILKADSVYQFSLTAITAFGCVAEVTLIDSVKKKPVKINYLSNTLPNSLTGCPGLGMTFWTSPSIGLKNYQWDFGDTSFSTLDTPTHSYSNIGTFPVKLTYTTPDGCTDTVWLRSVQTGIKPQATFSMSAISNTICGSSKIYFFDQTMQKPIVNWSWNFGDSSAIDHSPNPKHFYKDTGTYDLQFIVSNGTCADTLSLPKYFTVIPSIAYVDSIKYTCNGNRDTVTFIQKNKLVTSGKWYFGDGDSMIFDTSQRKITHIYQKEGVFMPILQSTGGTCLVRDTQYVYILQKQYPFLIVDTNRIVADTNVFCEQDLMSLRIKKSSIDTNYGALKSFYYGLKSWQYGDGSYYTGVSKRTKFFNTSYADTLNQLTPGKINIRAITTSNFFGCNDTSNYVKVKIKGPIAGYKIVNVKDCFKTPIVFKDTSKTTFNVPLAKWTWSFGDSTFSAETTNVSQNHKYASPDSFATYLRVTDTDGCTDSTRLKVYALPTGPKASFNWLPLDITTDTISTFTSTSDTFGCINTSYKWFFSSSKLSDTASIVQFVYPNPVTDKITLIVTNPANGCRDTAVNSITIKRAIAHFSAKVSYSGVTTSCPPALVTATSYSVGATEISWSFGDNTPGTGLLTNSTVGHTYNKPGRYTITLYAFNNNILSDSTSQTIIISGPVATLKSSIKKSCGPTIVGLTATQKNIDKIAWDFGDGNVTLPIKNDTIKTHLYNIAGTFTPSVLLADSLGCKSSFLLADSIVIDTLKANFTANKKVFCDTGMVVFTPKVNSYSGDSLQWSIKYSWNFGTNNKADTSNLLSSSFYYNKPGKYPVKQQVFTLAGCTVTNVDTIVVNSTPTAIIKVPKDVCENSPAIFTATTSNNVGVSWNWTVNNADSSTLQNPDPMYFKTTKDSSYNVIVKLLTVRNGCIDTAKSNLAIHPVPYFTLNVSPKKTPVCLNETITITAADGKNYVWYPDFNNVHGATFIDKPQKTTLYTVTAINQFNCATTDSTKVIVASWQHPDYTAERLLCKGSSIEIPVNGMDSIVWHYDSTTLSDFGNHPIAKPSVTTVYQFTASDKYKCFNYDGSIRVEVGTPPDAKYEAVNVLTGDNVKLNALSSTDIVSYSWSPATYLNCTDCAEPYCKPITDISFGVIVTNKYGCTTTDSLFVHLSCGESIYIPTAFAPNGLNKLFYPIGRGVQKVTYFRVFNRMGQLVYERNNFHLSDSNVGWNGDVKGKETNAGTYVYDLEAICDTGEVFHKKGTVVLIR